MDNMYHGNLGRGLLEILMCFDIAVALVRAERYFSKPIVCR